MSKKVWDGLPVGIGQTGFSDVDETAVMAASAVPVRTANGHHKRILTLLFVDLQASTQLAESLDLDSYDAFLTRFHAQVRQIVQAYHGSVVQVYGDGLLAVFGLLQDGEDSAFAATQAGLSITQDCARHLDGQKVRVGLHSGSVMCHQADVLPGMVTGFDVNLAARVQSEAPPNGVMVSGATFGLIEPIANVRIKSHGFKRLKGTRQPTELFEIGALTFRGRLKRETDFLGREPFLQGLLNSSPHCAKLILGPPGLGKTEVLKALQSKLAMHTKVVGLCARSNVMRSPLFPFRTWLTDHWGKVLDVVGTELSTMDRAILETLRIPSNLGALTQNLDAAQLGKLRKSTLVNVLHSYLVTQQAALLFDDVHCCDEASQSVVLELIKTLEATPFQIFLFGRDVGAIEPVRASAGVHAIELPVLSKEVLGQVLRSSGFNTAKVDVCEAILAKANGNPLYLLSMLETLGGDDKVSLPQSVESSIQAQLKSDPRFSDVLEAAAVLGQAFAARHLSAVGKDAVQFALGLEHLVAARVLRVGGGDVSFCHPLYRDVAYQMIPTSRRRELHSNCALEISRADPEFRKEFPELIADHIIEAQIYAEIPKIVIEASSRFLRQADLDQALHYLNHACDAVKEIEPNAEIAPQDYLAVLSLKAAAKVQKFGFGHDKVKSSYLELEREAAAGSGSDLSRMLAYYGLTSHRMISQSVRACRGVLQTTAKIAAHSESETRLLHLVHACAYNLYSARFDRVLEICGEVEEIYSPAAHSWLYLHTGADPLASVLSAAIYVRALRRDLEAATATYDRACAHLSDVSAHLQLPWLKIFSASAFSFAGERALGRQFLSQGVALADEQGARFWQLNGRLWQATLEIYDGRHEGQAQVLAELLPKFEAIGVSLSLTMHRSVLAFAEQRQAPQESQCKVIERALKSCLRADEVLWLPAIADLYGALENGAHTPLSTRLIRAHYQRSGAIFECNIARKTMDT